MTMKNDTPGFEEALIKLEECVQKLESGQMTLDESLSIFTEGQKWAVYCEEALNRAKGKIEKVIEKADGHKIVVPVDPEEIFKLKE